MEDLNVNLAIWGMFTNTTLRGAVHFGKDCDTNLRLVKNYLWETGHFFRETEKVISGQTETMPLPRSMCHVFSDSVLCLGKMGVNPVESWKKQIQWYSDNDYFSALNRIDGLWNSSGRSSQDSLQWESSMRFNR